MASACLSAAAWVARPMSVLRFAPSWRSGTCSPTSSRSCACTISMGAATISTRRIKILVNQLGIDKFREEVEADWAASPRKDEIDLPESELLRIQSYFAPPDLVPGPIVDEKVEQRRITDPAFDNWLKNNVRPH